MDFSSITSIRSSAYGSVQEFIFANLLGPLLYRLDLMSCAEDVCDGIDWFLFGCIQIMLIVVVLRTWERFTPAETQEGFAKVSRADLFLSLIHISEPTRPY